MRRWESHVVAMAALTAALITGGPAWAATGTRTSAFEYDPVSGLLTKEVVEPGAPQLRLETGYTYDAFGNKTAAIVSSPATGEAAIAPRTSTTTFDPQGRFASTAANALNHGETRAYDPRFGGVTSLTGPNGLTTQWQYDVFGRKTLEIRADGTRTKWEYFYCAPINGSPWPCASPMKYFSSISGTLNTAFTYDANGNMQSGNGRTMTWTSFNMPATITRGTNTLSFAYDGEHGRIKQVAPDGTTLYVNDPGSGVRVERFTGTGGAVRWNNYVYAAGGIVAVFYENSSGPNLTRYFHKDHLGSTAVITDETGAVLERLSYDPWGKRRFPNGTDDPGETITSLTDRGFTGHEHLQEVGLVHMNGRVYDPQIGRFLSADPFVQDPFDTQSLNRYSYCVNNPLAYTDPNGFFFKKLFGSVKNFVKFLVSPVLANPRLAIAIAIAALGQPHLAGALAAAGVPASGAVAGVIGGAITSAIMGGDFKSIVAGAITGGIFGGIGDVLNSTEFAKVVGGEAEKWLAGAALHGLGGGVTSVIQGGDFGSGFLSAGFAALAGPLVPDIGTIGNTITRAIIGGTASLIGGGKFTNGAITAAFAYLFNDEGHRLSNAERHNAMVEHLAGKLHTAGDQVFTPRIVIFPDGTHSEVDVVSRTREGEVRVREVKIGPHARWTPTQAGHFQELIQGNYRLLGVPGINPNLPVNQQGIYSYALVPTPNVARILRSGRTEAFRTRPVRAADQAIDVRGMV